MNDKAQAMIDELVAACIAFGRQVEPGWQTRIEKAQRELREYIAELEGESERFTVHSNTERQDDKWIPLEEVQESEATSCKFCGSNKSDRRMNSIVCSSCGRKIGNVAPPEVK